MDTISLRRRHLMIAGVAGVAAPAFAFAGRSGELPASAALERREIASLVVSGRVVGAPDGKPLADAVIETWPASPNAAPAVATADADGRFVLFTSAEVGPEGRPQAVRYRVRYAGRELPAAQLDTRTTPRGAATPWQRDDAGVWRTSLALNVA